MMVVFMSLSACGEGTDKNAANKINHGPAKQTSTDTSANGPDLFSKYGCFACHSLDGSVMYGPPLNDLYMKEVSVLRQGKEKTVVADREYLIKAITDPDYEKVSEYQRKIMPKPVIPEHDVEVLIDYLIGLGEEE